MHLSRIKLLQCVQHFFSLHRNCQSEEKGKKGRNTLESKQNQRKIVYFQKAYRKHLKFNKYIHINSAIKECENSLFKMYNLIFGLIGRRKDNPMPEARNVEALANDFLDYFMGKIEISVVDAGVERSNCIRFLGGYLDEQINEAKNICV